jgi:MFS family permease
MALGLIEGLADGLSGAAKFGAGPLADDPGRRRSIAVGGYTLTAILSALIGLATAVWQVVILRSAAWIARGVRGPARYALLADAVEPDVYGRAYGFERAMDNAGAVLGPLAALLLVSLVGIREAILLSVVPGLLAAVAIIYAVRHLRHDTTRGRTPIRIVVRPLLRGPLGRLFVAIATFEAGNMAATLLILRATELLAPGRDASGAAGVAILLYVAYNLAATLASFPAGWLVDRFGGPRLFALGALCFGAAYAGFAAADTSIAALAAAFVLAGIAIGVVETAEHASVATMAPPELRGSSFGLLAAIQSAGDFVASVAVGAIWTLVSPTAAFAVAAVVVAAGGLLPLGLGRTIGVDGGNGA